MRYFRAPILNSLLFRSYLCINVKGFVKKIFDWATIGGDRIVPRILGCSDFDFFSHFEV